MITTLPPIRPALTFWRWTLVGGCLALLALLSACGFHLKTPSPLPFNRLYTNISDNSPFGAQLQRQLKASSPGLQFVSQPEQAQAQLIQLSLQRYTRELSIDPQGQVEDYEPTVNLTFQLLNDQQKMVLPPTTLTTRRDLPYDANAVQAKQSEISSLFLSMEQSLIDQLVRRLTASEVTERFTHNESLPTAEFIAPTPNEIGSSTLNESLELPTEFLFSEPLQ